MEKQIRIAKKELGGVVKIFLVVEMVAGDVACMGTRQDAGETVGQACWRGQRWPP